MLFFADVSIFARPPFNSLASGWFRGFSEKKRLNTCGFALEFIWCSMLYKPDKSLKTRGKSSSLHLKKNFLLGGCSFSVSDVISGGFLGHLGPLCLPWGHQPLGGSISLKFLLETRLQSESFGTFDDLLGFRVQKL